MYYKNPTKKRKVSKSKPFVPENPFVSKIQGMFSDEETSDVLFEIITTEPDEDGSKRFKTSTPFSAHRLILQMCAPMLEALLEPTYLLSSDGKLATATITDIKPAVFHHLFWYVYGGSVPEEELKTHAKDIIEAADKYNIVNLKLEAEAAYVDSTAITAENAIDNLLYADAKNCALLTEAVMDFLTQSGEEVTARLSFDDVPGYLMKDLLVAATRKRKTGNKGDRFNMMRVSELRRKLHEKGLDANSPAVDVAGACQALRGQRCVVGDQRFACAQLQYIHSRCSGVHHSRTADGKHGLYCTQSELTDYEDNEFVDVLATHGTTDCAVLSAGDGCVDDTATVGLKCKDGLTCEGFAKSTVAGTPDTLGICKGTAATRNAEPAASEPAAPPAPTPAASPSSPDTEAPSSGNVAGLFALHISVAVGVLHYFLL